MKKNVWGRIALLLAAGAILFGSLGCSSDDDDDDDVAVESVTLDTTTKSIVAGETFDLAATVLPDNATDKSVTWSSSDEKVATVDTNGKVTAVSAGSATITAKAGEKTATCEVTVTAAVVFKSQSAEVDLSEKVSSIASATSSDTNVATVIFDGTKLTVTSVASGTATITVIAATSENSVSGTVSVTVAEDGAVTAEDGEFTKIESKAAESISLDQTTASVVAESSVTLKATVTPADTTDSVTWTSDNTDVATVDNNGKVTGVAEGTATITAKAGDKSAACEVTVTAKPAEVAVTGVTLDKETAELEIDGTVELKATVSPDGATDKTVTWSSSDEKVATVDNNGKVTGVAAGTATITAKAGDKTATCAITVKAAEASPVTYSFSGSGVVTLDQLSEWDMDSKDVIGAPVSSSGNTMSLSNGATIYWKGSKTGTLRFRSKHDAKSTLTQNNVDAITALNYNGGDKNTDFSSSVTISSLDRYVSIPVSGAGTVTASIKFKGSTSATDNKTIQAVLCDATGKTLASKTAADNTDTEATLTATVTDATTIYVAFSRVGASGGGLDITSITFTPSN